MRNAKRIAAANAANVMSAGSAPSLWDRDLNHGVDLEARQRPYQRRIAPGLCDRDEVPGVERKDQQRIRRPLLLATRIATINAANATSAAACAITTLFPA